LTDKIYEGKDVDFKFTRNVKKMTNGEGYDDEEDEDDEED